MAVKRDWAALGCALIMVMAGATLSFAGQTDAGAVDTPATGSTHLDKVEHGRTLFADAGCGACHSLADAKAEGTIGPSLDGNNSLTEALIVSRVTDGAGPMPPFSGQLSESEIADVAAYVMHVAAR